MPLVLSNSEGISRSCTLKQIKILQNNVLVNHSNGLFWSIDSFKLRKSGTAKLSDIIVQEGKQMSGILKKHIKTGMDKCKANGFALEDIIIDKLASSDGGNQDTPEDQNLFYSQDCTVLSQFSVHKSDPISRIYPHDSLKEAIKILEIHGTVTDVSGDGSCGYHAVMLLLNKVNLIPKDMTLYQF